MKLSQLQKRAADVGVDGAKLEDAEDGENPKQDIIELIIDTTLPSLGLAAKDLLRGENRFSSRISAPSPLQPVTVCLTDSGSRDLLDALRSRSGAQGNEAEPAAEASRRSGREGSRA